MVPLLYPTKASVYTTFEVVTVMQKQLIQIFLVFYFFLPAKLVFHVPDGEANEMHERDNIVRNLQLQNDKHAEKPHFLKEIEDRVDLPAEVRQNSVLLKFSQIGHDIRDLENLTNKHEVWRLNFMP